MVREYLAYKGIIGCLVAHYEKQTCVWDSTRANSESSGNLSETRVSPFTLVNQCGVVRVIGDVTNKALVISPWGGSEVVKRAIVVIWKGNPGRRSFTSV
jgi:hypothetical protein